MNQIINTDLNKNKIDQESDLELSNNNKKNEKSVLPQIWKKCLLCIFTV